MSIVDEPDPYALWRDARASAPVARVAEGDRREIWWVTRFADVERVLRDGDTFSSAINDETMGPVMGRTLVAMDGVEHRRYRDLVAKAFRPSAVERWGEELIRPTLVELLERLRPRGRADLVADLTRRFPVQVIAAILGVPVEDHERFQEWAEGINHGPTDLSVSVPASKAMTDYLRPIVAARRAAPGDDLLSELVTAEVDGHTLDDAHLYGFLRLLLPAGAETTYRLLGSLLHSLLTHPGALDAVRADRALVPAAVEETLRYETSVTVVNRTPVVDADVGGCVIPAGVSLLAATGSANRDESRYDRPDEWDLHRRPQPHLAFGTGRHQCLGMHLARLELRVALEEVLDRLPGLRPDPDDPLPPITGFAFRSPPRLPVVFD